MTSSPQFAGTAATAGAIRVGVFWKRDNGSESPPTIADTGDHTIGRIYAFRGCIETGLPYVDPAGQVNSTTNVDRQAYAPQITYTTGGVMVVLISGEARDSRYHNHCIFHESE